MHDLFLSLDQEKRDRILNAAFEEFSKNRFAKASTNAIVENAGISKGILYHYFKSKKKLYDYLVEFAFTVLADALEADLDWHQSDFFSRVKDAGMIKMKISARYPHMTGFTRAVMAETPPATLKAYTVKYNPSIYQAIYHKNIDFSKFKPSVDLEKAIKIIQWTFERFSDHWCLDHKDCYPIDFDALSKESDVYMEMLKKTFYNEEAL